MANTPSAVATGRLADCDDPAATTGPAVGWARLVGLDGIEPNPELDNTLSCISQTMT